MKNKPILDFEGQKKFYNKFDYDTLETLEVLYEVLEKKTPISFDIIYKRKSDIAVANGDFEGMNEYPSYEDLIDRFSLQKIIDKFKDLSDNEIKYITEIIKEALSTIEDDEEANKIVPELKRFLETQDNETIDRLSFVIGDTTENELTEFFNKYHVIELEAFDDILKYSTLENLDTIKRIKNEVYEKKYIKLKRNYEKGVKPLGFTLESLAKKNSLLDDKQLDLLHTIIANTVMNLEVLYDFSTDDEEINIDSEALDNLLALIELEQQSRINNKNKELIKTKPTPEE